MLEGICKQDLKGGLTMLYNTLSSSYYQKTIIAGSTIEKFKYKSGRKDLKIKVLPASKVTTEKQRKQNEKNAAMKVRWYINTNFNKGDWWITFTYPANVRPSSQQVRSDVDKFTRELRKIYRKEGKTAKYIMAVGIGKRGAAHLHMVINFIDAQKIADAWRSIVGTPETPYPTMNFKSMDGRKNHADLAAYIIKNSCESFYDSKRRVYAKRFCNSTNLKKPITIIRKIKAKNWRPPRPVKGYYVDKQYTHEGITGGGYPYQHYILVCLDAPMSRGGPKELKKI